MAGADAADQTSRGVHSPEQFVAAYEAALAMQDWSAVEPLVHERACVTFSNGSVHEGKPAVQAAFERNFSLIKSEEYSIDNVRWVSRNEAMATYLFDYTWKGVIDGREAGGEGRGTCVLVRDGGQWKMLAEHLGPRAR